MVKIRKIEMLDLADYVRLAKQLGYDADIEHVTKCIKKADSSEIVYVAEKNDKVIGWIDARICCTYLSKDYGEIVGFIVDENERNHGIGKSLLKKVELWVKQKDIQKILLHSNKKREKAHEFYKNNGYKYIKESKLFRKEI